MQDEPEKNKVESGSESGSVKVKRRIRILADTYVMFSKHVNVDSNSQKIELYH